METRKVIISLAPVKAGVPINQDRLVEDVIASEKAGAAMCHLHCRTAKGELTKDTTEMVNTFERIYNKTELILQASTGGISEMNIQDRCKPLEYPRIESASLNGGTTNLGEAIYINSFEDIRYCAKKTYEFNIIPEIEVFDIGMIHNILLTRQDVLYRDPILYNLVFGHKGGMPAQMEGLLAFRSMVPKDALWGVTHYGRANWEFLAAAISLGASGVRIGFEDSDYLTKEQNATTNCELVEKLVTLIEAMDLKAASPEEARKIIGIC